MIGHKTVNNKSYTRKIMIVKDPKVKLVAKKTRRRSRYEMLLDSIYDAVLITDSDGYILEVNARAVEMFEFAWDDFKNLHISSLVEKMDRKILKTLHGNVDEKRYTVLEGRCLRKDQSNFNAEIAVGAERLESDDGLVFFIRNITQRKEMESQLRAANHALMNAAIGIVITDLDGAVQTANPAFLETWGYTADSDVLGRSIEEFFENAKEIRDIVGKVKTSYVCMNETVGRKKEGDTFRVQMSAAPNVSENNHVYGIVFSLRDNTDTHETQEALKRASEQQLESERVKTRLSTISTLGFALNNPLQGLLSMAEIDGRDEYKTQILRMISIVQELQSSEPLKVIKSPDGVERYKLSSPAHLAPCREKSVLLVDDEELIIKHFSNFMNNAFPDASVEAARNGAEAVKRFEQGHHRLILLDCIMPGMNGEDAYAAIEKICEERDWQMPNIIFCTGFMPSEKIRELAEGGNSNHLLTKPISKEDLMTAISPFMNAGKEK